MTLKSLALKAAVLKAVLEYVKAEDAGTRDELREGLRAAHEESGAKSLDVRLPSGEQVATVTLPLSSAGPSITDEAALIEWARESRPEWLIEVPATVRLNTARLYEEVTYVGAQAVTGGGEIVPGITYDLGGKPKSPSVRFTTTGRQAIADAWADGTFGMALPGIAPALPEVTR